MKIDVPGRSPEGALLRELRIRADLTQRMVGERAGYAASMVAQVEVGLWRPNDHFIRSVASVLKLSLAEEQQLIKLRDTAWKGRRHKKRTLKTLAEENAAKAASTVEPTFSDAA